MAIEAVNAGGSMLDSRILEPLVAAGLRVERSPLAALTPRARVVLAEMAKGKSNAAIADALVLTKRAVEKHIKSIFLKLNPSHAEDVSKRVKALRGSKTRVPGLAAAGRGLWEHRRMLLSFAYLAFSAVLRLLVRSRSSEFARTWNCSCYDISSSCAGANRRAPPWKQPIVLSSRRRLGCSRVGARRGLIVTPQTLLRWHRELVRRTWTRSRRRPGRPAATTATGHEIKRRDRLGGLIHEYHRAAA